MPTAHRRLLFLALALLSLASIAAATAAGSVSLSWDQWLLGERGREAKAAFVGMSDFGASAPAGELFEHFGITAEAAAQKVRDML